VVELQSVEFQKIGKEERWRHTETPLHVRFEHHDFGGVRDWHRGLEVSPPSRFGLRSHGALAFQSLDVSVLDMGFLPIPMEVLGDLLFFILDPFLLFLLSLAIRFLVCGILNIVSCHLFFWLRRQRPLDPNPPLQDGYPELTAAEGNPPPQPRSGGGEGDPEFMASSERKIPL
jgi:hypothetical protein